MPKTLAALAHHKCYDKQEPLDTNTCDVSYVCYYFVLKLKMIYFIMSTHCCAQCFSTYMMSHDCCHSEFDDPPTQCHESQQSKCPMLINITIQDSDISLP
jgi:hypothetical protein